MAGVCGQALLWKDNLVPRARDGGAFVPNPPPVPGPGREPLVRDPAELLGYPELRLAPSDDDE